MDTTTNKFFAIVVTVAAIILLLNFFCKSAHSEEIPKLRAINAIIGEAEGEPFNGKVAIACAIRNRGTLKGVYGEKAKRVINKLYSKKIYNDAKTAWEQSSVNGKCDFVDGADHWEGTAFPEPSWAKSMTLVATIGNQRFYRR